MKWNLVKKHRPTGLAEIEPFDVTKILEILMTANNHEWMGKLNGKKLLVSDVIILFRWGQFLGVVCARLEVRRLTELLREHGPYSGGGGIHFHHKWHMRIWDHEEPLQFLHRLGAKPLLDDRYIPLVHLDSILADDVYEELHGGAMEFTLLHLEE